MGRRSFEAPALLEHQFYRPGLPSALRALERCVDATYARDYIPKTSLVG